MVNRVSTVGNYEAILANLRNAQLRHLEANERVSTQKNGDDLKGFARSDELLTATRSLQTRIGNFQEQNGLIADKLTTQDTQLKQVAEAAKSVHDAIGQALAIGNASTLFKDLQTQLDRAVVALNTRYNGNFIFAGGQVRTQPVTATTLAGLVGPPVASFFENDQFKTQAQLDDSTSVTTGLLASDIATPLLAAFQVFATFDASPLGPFNGTLTPAQRTFLESQLVPWDDVHAGVVRIAAQNGNVQKRVDEVKANLESQSTTVTLFISGIVDADIAKASVDLTLAENSFQAVAAVVQSLKNSTLLNLLPIN